MAKTNTPNEDENNNTPNAKDGEKIKRVRVIFAGVLGHRGLREGSVTDDPDYVALLKTKHGRTLVEEVK